LPQCECGAVYWLSVEDLKAPGVWVANTECWLQGHYAIDSQCQAPQTATGNLLPKTQTTQTPHQDTPTFSGKEAPEKATPQVAQTPGQTSPSPAVIEPHPGPDDNSKPGNVYSIVCTPIKQKINATDQAKIDKIVIHVHFDSRDPHTRSWHCESLMRLPARCTTYLHSMTDSNMPRTAGNFMNGAGVALQLDSHTGRCVRLARADVFDRFRI
jgi:hypothetical protein